jgi:hypothetical protein
MFISKRQNNNNLHHQLLRFRPCELLYFRITYEIISQIDICQDSWTGDQPDARPLPPYDITTQKDE